MNGNNIMMEIGNPKNWKKTQKKQYEIYVCMPKLGTNVTNHLEGSNYVTDENKRFVLSGTAGEKWVIDAAKLAKTYTWADGTEINNTTIQSKLVKGTKVPYMQWKKIRTKPGGGAPNWAFHLPKHIVNFPVNTSWGDVLLANRPEVQHGLGDFLVCADAGGRPNLNDMWVVNGLIFPATYDLRAFPGMFNAQQLEALNAPVPRDFNIPKEDLNIPQSATVINTRPANAPTALPRKPGAPSTSEETKRLATIAFKALSSVRGIKVKEPHFNGKSATLDVYSLGNFSPEYDLGYGTLCFTQSGNQVEATFAVQYDEGQKFSKSVTGEPEKACREAVKGLVDMLQMFNFLAANRWVDTICNYYPAYKAATDVLRALDKVKLRNIKLTDFNDTDGVRIDFDINNTMFGIVSFDPEEVTSNKDNARLGVAIFFDPSEDPVEDSYTGSINQVYGAIPKVIKRIIDSNN